MKIDNAIYVVKKPCSQRPAIVPEGESRKLFAAGILVKFYSTVLDTWQGTDSSRRIYLQRADMPEACCSAFNEKLLKIGSLSDANNVCKISQH